MASNSEHFYSYRNDPRYKECIDIGSWSSTCCNCGKEALPDEKAHLTRVGYGPQNGDPGCGITWKYYTSGYSGLGLDNIVERKWPWLKPLPYDSEF